MRPRRTFVQRGETLQGLRLEIANLIFITLAARLRRWERSRQSSTTGTRYTLDTLFMMRNALLLSGGLRLADTLDGKAGINKDLWPSRYLSCGEFHNLGPEPGRPTNPWSSRRPQRILHGSWRLIARMPLTPRA